MERHERRAALLLAGACLGWLHQWIPALLAAVFVLWVVLHGRLEGELGGRLRRRWRHLWPPRTVLLVPLLLAVTLAFWTADAPVRAKVLPVALGLAALSILAFGWGRKLTRTAALSSCPIPGVTE